MTGNPKLKNEVDLTKDATHITDVANLKPHSQHGREISALKLAAANITANCDECGACVQQCRFLESAGTPASIATLLGQDNDRLRELAFQCSLCSLCTATCSKGAAPTNMFLEVRREAISQGNHSLKKYGPLLQYEKRGTSKTFTWYALPEGCDTILFPGCNMPGSRPGVTMDLFHHLQKSIPSLGIVLDCCNKPSHDLGRQDHFESLFHEMIGWLKERGIRNVLVACPNCHKMFRQYAQEFTTSTVYEHMAVHGIPEGSKLAGEVTIHDPCPLRTEIPAMDASRTLATNRGYTITEMRHNLGKTLCCGEGGGVPLNKPEFAKAWSRKRADEAMGRTALTSCAGCGNFLSRHMNVTHILDVLFRPEAVAAGKTRVIPSPFTYLARLRIKRILKRTVNAMATRERTFYPTAGISSETSSTANTRIRRKGIAIASLAAFGMLLWSLLA